MAGCEVAAVWAARLQRTTADSCLEEAHQLLFLHEAPLRPHGTDAGMVPRAWTGGELQKWSQNQWTLTSESHTRRL